jgi:hypothetical protein
MVRVQDSEGVANHADPESCAVARKDEGEALTGVRVGRVLSRERRSRSGCPHRVARGKQHPTRRYRKARRDPARSETPRMHGGTLRGNREVPRPPAAEGAAGRIGKSEDVIR